MSLSVPTIAVLTAAALGFGYLLIGALALVLRDRMQLLGLLRVLLIETLIAAVVVGAFLAGGGWLVLGMALLTFRVVLEAATVNRLAHPGRVPPVVLATGCGAIALLVPLAGAKAALVLLACWAAIGGLRAAGIGRGEVEPVLFPALPVLASAALATGTGTAALALVAYLLVEIFDSFALFFGKLLGRHRPFPRLSPGKTLEGLVGGAAALFLCSALGSVLLADADAARAAGLAALVAVAGLAGDLAASATKRRAGVKDYPGGIPHQGGILDIADSWIAVTACLSIWSVLAPVLG